jgi:phenylpropionate dioxygenase-like ring-hydroxylating dioxygenase large terminal subunit
MRREPHPLTGFIYQEQADGIVKVQNPENDKHGLFKWDGTWLEGDITYADPHLLIYVGGPNLPNGKDIYWGMSPPVYEPVSESADGAYSGGGRVMDAVGEAPKVVGKYQTDEGKTTDAGARSSAHYEMNFFLDNDRRPDLVPDIYRIESPMEGQAERISTDRFHEQKFHDLEVEKIWKCTWQMACREDDIPDIGDYHIYEIADQSFIVVRTGENEFKAHRNVCLHRGRVLRETDGKNAKDFRCAFHGWSWNLDGKLKEITCEWDFPGAREDVSELPGATLSTWAGFIFINPDPNAEPLEEFLGPVMMAHYEKFKFENRYKQAHVSRVMQANWKVIMEAFMEAYHVIATHPQLLLGGGDAANARIDVFGNWGRGSHLSNTSDSPQRGIFLTDDQALAEYRMMADVNRDFLKSVIGDEVEQFSDAELTDGAFNDLFPNLHPWGGWARIVFRFRPNGNNPDECIMDVILLAPWPEGKPKPPAAKVHQLAPDEAWINAPELGSLARIIDQDCLNLPKVQKGLKAKQPEYVWYSSYAEGKIRNFHKNYNRKLGLKE